MCINIREKRINNRESTLIFELVWYYVPIIYHLVGGRLQDRYNIEGNVLNDQVLDRRN